MKASSRIKQIRQTLGISARVFGEFLGCTAMTISNYENGKSDVPMEVFYKLIDIGVDADFMAYIEDKPFITIEDMIWSKQQITGEK